MSRIIQLPVDSKLTESLHRLNRELEKTGEEIVNTTQVDRDGKQILMVSVRESGNKGKSKHLLLGQIERGETRDVFSGKRVLLD